MMLLKIVLSFMKVCLMTFGGAYASIPLVAKEVVEVQQWMTYTEFADLLALDELTPGPIMINCATFVGMKVAGVPGAIAATVGCVIPSIVVTILLSWLYRKYEKVPIVSQVLGAMKCMSLALIAVTFFNLAKDLLLPSAASGGFEVQWLLLFLMVASFLLIRKDTINPLFILLTSGVIHLVAGLIFSR